MLATRTARPGREAEFIAHLERLRHTLAGQPGHLDTAVLLPVAPYREALVIYRFDRPETLHAWQQSAARRDLLDESAAFTLDPPRERAVLATDSWFAGTCGRVLRPPARWKTWLISSLAIWVLFTAISLAGSTLLNPLPAPLRFAVVVPALGALMTWPVMPALTRWLSGWLLDD